MRRLGAEGPSFPSIVAAGPHSALPHAEPRDVEIPPGTLLTIDWGALHEGYCSDCTRTFATGALEEEARAVYELVLLAQLEGLAAVRPGPTGREVDRAARDVDRAGRPRRALRPRPRPRRRPRDPRGPPPVPHSRRAAPARRQRRHGRARRLPAGPLRGAHRGSGRRHPGGAPRPERAAQGAHRGGLRALRRPTHDPRRGHRLSRSRSRTARSGPCRRASVRWACSGRGSRRCEGPRSRPGR